jgi:type I restriction enzyme S subunit
MDVKHGYKQTEAGVIPEDWETIPFQFLANIERGKFSARPRNDPKYYGGEIPFIQTGDVKTSSGWIRTYSQTLNREGLKVSKLFPEGTLFLTIAANVGDVGFASFDTACPDSLVAITPVNRVDKRWLAHELRSRKPAFEKLASHNAQLNLNLEKLRPYLLPVPSSTEQQEIAEGLSDADALIESLEHLLAKKRQIKQGAMQELLTGKKRLPGFSGEWEVKRLGEICEIAMGRTPSRLNPKYWGGGYKWLSISDLRTKVVTESREEITALAAVGMQVIPKGTLLMSFKLSIGRLCFAGCDLYSNEAICSFNKLRANVDFLYYALGQTDFSLYGKQAVKGYTLNSESLKLVEVLLPGEAEQISIATLLSDMDAEIAALEAKLTKARQIKQGMMQELLTGRIRLV